MGKVGSVSCVGFFMEGTGPVFCWMRLDLVFPVRRTASCGVFCGVCELIMILGRLSANAWVVFLSC